MIFVVHKITAAGTHFPDLFLSHHDVLGMILFLRFGVPILGYIASVISMSFYKLTDQRYAEILKELEEKRK